MNSVWNGALHALGVAGSMAWQVTWSLILGFTLSAIIESLVRKSTIARLLPDDRARSLATATGLGAASSSCSFAAVALARSLFRKGADFTSAMAFQFASTNLVIELGLILGLLLGWQFTAAEFLGGPVMIVVLALLFRRFLSPRLRAQAREQADRAVAGSMEGHAAMDMAITGRGSIVRRLATAEGFTATANVFVMEWAAVLRDIAAGLLIAGALAAWVPGSFWRSLFLEHHATLAKFWGPLIGPVVAIVSFVCSIGNVPLAAVLWNGGISFGGVLAFIFADLIILPILDIYRRYYGWKMTGFLLAAFYATMAGAGLTVEFLFQVLGIERTERNARIETAHIAWNYTTYLNVVFLAIAAALLWRYFRRGGGLQMLRLMNAPPARMRAT